MTLVIFANHVPLDITMPEEVEENWAAMHVMTI